jgi:hypothetical protein
MRHAVRLTRRQDGGFRLEGVAAAAIEGVPRDGGFAVAGETGWSLGWSAAERGWILIETTGGREAGRTTASDTGRTLAPSSVLLADGRLFRLGLAGASDPRVELSRWEVPGAYAVGRPESGSWTLEKTIAGESLPAGPELWILACAEIGRLDGWW